MKKPPTQNEQDELAIIELKNHEEFKAQSSFGISHIQRSLKWGYNRSAASCDRLLEKGVLVRCDPTRPYLMSFASKFNTVK